MKGYKGFEPGLICRGKQYEENTVFEEDGAEICERGMHFCENPFDVINYYPLVKEDGSFSDFAEVEALEKAETDDSKKFCTKKLRIGAKLSFGEFVRACVEFVFKKTEALNAAQIGSAGDCAKIGSAGDCAKIGSSGYAAQIGSAGDCAKIGSSGDCAKIGSADDYAQINCTGASSVICCAGNGSTVKAKAGCWITLSEWDWIDNKWIPVCVKTEYVDGERIKADTWYRLQNGQFVEVEQDE